MTDWSVVHDACIDHICTLADGLTEAQVATVVAATPAWTVHDVYAHMAGGSTDGVTGRMDGAPSPQWTARHVGERSDTPLADLVAELRSTQATLSESVKDAPRPALVWDRAVHLADLHEALGMPRPASVTWGLVAETMAPRVAKVLDDREAPSSIEPYELFRAVFSRRSRAQLTALFPSATPEQLDELGIFGPRDDDQPIAH